MVLHRHLALFMVRYSSRNVSKTQNALRNFHFESLVIAVQCLQTFSSEPYMIHFFIKTFSEFDIQWKLYSNCKLHFWPNQINVSFPHRIFNAILHKNPSLSSFPPSFHPPNLLLPPFSPFSSPYSFPPSRPSFRLYPPPPFQKYCANEERIIDCTVPTT